MEIKFLLLFKISKLENTIEMHEKEFLLIPSDIQLMQQIGTGSFGTGIYLLCVYFYVSVFRAKWRGTLVAGYFLTCLLLNFIS